MTAESRRISLGPTIKQQNKAHERLMKRRSVAAMTAAPPSPSPEALAEARNWFNPSLADGQKRLAVAFDRFAAEAVVRHELDEAAKLQAVLGDPRVGVHVPPADWGLPQNAAEPPGEG